MNIGIVFGTFAPMHLGHKDVITIAKEEMDKVIVICCGHEGDRGYPKLSLEKRYELAKEEFAEDPQVLVTMLWDTDPKIKEHWDQQQIWNYWVERMLLHFYKNEFITARDVLTFYTSEGDYTELLENVTEHIAVHKCKRNRPISGTMIREDMDKYQDFIVPSYKKYLLDK